MRIRNLFPRESIGWRIAWRSHEITSKIFHNAYYYSPVLRAFRALAYAAKPWGVISGGTDCDGMRYAGADVFWTHAAADFAAEESYNSAEGPHGAEVVSGREAREFSRDHEPDTRDRFAESMGY